MISVLLVDDDPDLLEVARLHLEMSGSFSADTCRSASGALSNMTKKQYDAIIADYNMPVMNGVDLLRELKSRGDTTPFIMMSGSFSEDAVIDALNTGVTFFLKKGMDLDEPFGDLQHKVQIAVQQKQSDRNLQLFSAVSRHDLLNKVAALSGYMELVQAHTDDRTILDYMTKQQTVLSAIRDQIQFTEDYENVGVQQPFWQRLVPLIQKSASLLPEVGIALILEGTDGIELYADPLLMKVFYNLIDNSLHHGEHVTSIRISGKKDGENFLIVYEDNGVGIPDSEKESIFIRIKGKNTGLGLFLIREILAITNIRIHETGVMGNGARFEITVPENRFRAQ
jgi:CheY-like chemotaxis protein